MGADGVDESLALLDRRGGGIQRLLGGENAIWVFRWKWRQVCGLLGDADILLVRWVVSGEIV